MGIPSLTQPSRISFVPSALASAPAVFASLQSLRPRARRARLTQKARRALLVGKQTLTPTLTPICPVRGGEEASPRPWTGSAPRIHQLKNNSDVQVPCDRAVGHCRHEEEEGDNARRRFSPTTIQ